MSDGKVTMSDTLQEGLIKFTMGRFAVARGAAESVKPGVERSVTPGTAVENIRSPRSGRQSNRMMIRKLRPLSAAPRALQCFVMMILGFRCAPPQGFMPSAAPRAK